MTEKLDFLPWVRRGGPAGPPAFGRPVTSVSFTLSDGANNESPELAFAQPGPGDVTGLHPGAIRQTVPPPGDADAEENHCAYVEFAAEDLPWRYGFSDQQQRPLPWCVLVVGEPADVVVQGDQVHLGVPPQLTHRLSEARLWAHVQRPRGGGVGSGLSRVVSAAPQQPATAYVAALVVPWMADGRPAWSGAAPVTVPCLHSWSFRTGEEGTFETLAVELHPADDDPVGTVQVRLPGGATVDVPGALTSIGFELEPLTVGHPARDHDILVDGTDRTGRRRVQSPAYGAPWLTHEVVRHDVAAAAQTNPDQWSWHVQVNADLRLRAIAGVGLQAGIDLQEQIVTAADHQWGAGRWVHDLVSAFSVGSAAAESLWSRRLPTSTAQKLMLLGPAAHRVPVADGSGAVTLAGALGRPAAGDAPFPLGTLGPRLARSLGATALHDSGGANAIVEVAAAGVPTPARPADAVDQGVAELDQVDAGHLDAVGRRAERDTGGEVTPDQAEQALVDAVHAVLELSVVLEQPEEPGLRRPRPAAIVDVLVDALRPGGADSSAGRRVVDRLEGVVEDEPFAAPLDCPDLDLPAWPYLRDVVPHWLLPGAESLGQGEVAAMRTCPEFVEAFLLGLNHRALGELAWRQHPVMVGCTPLRRFWDQVPSAARHDEDIRGVQAWQAGSRLGAHPPPAIRSDKLVVVVRSPLFRRYPRTLLFLAPSTTSPPTWTRGHVDLANPVMPAFVAAMGPDLTMFAFDVEPTAVTRHWVVVQEMPEGLRFGRDQSVGTHAGAWASANVDTPIRVMLPGPDTVAVGGGP